MQKSIIHKLLLARRLLDLARENLSSTNELSLAIGVNLLQDAVEAFLLAVAEQVNAKIQGKTGFEQYIDLIDDRISPKSLPFRARLLALNKLRVSSKHFGIAPAKSEVSGLLVTVRELFDEVASSILGVTFASVSLIDLLKDGEAKDLVRDAAQAFENGDFETCLFNCRKALFVRIERDYDVAPFAEEKKGLGFALRGRKAPYYARSKEYIEKTVCDPTDYIVLDHSELDMDLMRKGIDTVSFWNVWRLTPEVYRSDKKNSTWVHKRDFAKLESDGLRERAEYVLDTTITMLASADQKAAASRWTEPRKYSVKLKRDGAPIYEKATTNSSQKSTVPPGIGEVHVDYQVDALDSSGSFWHVSHYDEKFFLTGFLSNDDVAE